MKQFDVYLLDLDGTISDSKPGIINSIRYALGYFNIEQPTDEFLNNFIGPPLVKSFQKFYNFSDSDAAAALKKYRERYEEKGIYELSLYPFVKETLARLNQNGKTLALATSKVTQYAEKILSGLSVAQYFRHVQGADFEGKFSEKPDVVRLCLEHLNRKKQIDKQKTVMVGDRSYDIIGAKQNGIKCIGAVYGYGGENELKEHGADYLIYSLKELI